ncbi:adhesion G protein-coupled receptor E1-like isoform X2 [Rhineura floridana]|uniref:adhesion G protein-coupled receptor E1-like isoform X2 n=1 Tax=Rhineura floridana TaxID=261503 RepID=UPI002AC8818B|nr:adhesion G protein-coupled receptor E1-like isoform X2 [Rhineura floridana]
MRTAVSCLILGRTPRQQLSDEYWNLLYYTGLVSMDDENSDGGIVKDCGPNSVPSSKSSCVCKEGYRMVSRKMTSLGTSQTTCEKIAYHCQQDVVRENDNVRTCFNATKPEDNLNHNSFYCLVVVSTFRLLRLICENGSLRTTSLQSIEAKEEVGSVVMWGLKGLGSASVAKALASPEKQSQTVVTNSVVIQTRIINEEDISKNETLHLKAQGDQMAIDPRALTDKTTQGPVAVAFISYSRLQSFLNGTFPQDETALNSKVLQKSCHMNSRITSASASSWMRNLSRPVNLTFHHLENKVPQEKAICVHWNSAGRDGAWSPEGCRHLRSNTTHSECSCRYLSSYAVLMAPILKQGDLILSIISYIGLIMSLICLFLTIVTFLCCRSIQNSSTFIHLQLSICLFFADLLFIIGIDKTYNKILCSVIAGTLQYLFLACFMWMFLEGMNLYVVKNLKVANYSGASKRMKISMYLSGYGLPAMIVAISAAIAPTSYGTHNCWITYEEGFIWSFLGPVCAITVINIVFFCLILKILHEKLVSLNSEVSTLKNTRSLTFKAIAHVFILGLTWCLGLFQFGPLADVMAYLFTITSSVQGVFIFLVHCLLNRKVREIYWCLISCKKDIQPPVSEMTMTSVIISSPKKNEESTASGQQQKVEWEGEA